MSDLSTLLPTESRVQLGPVVLTVPVLSALDWIRALDRAQPVAILELCSEGRDDALMALATGQASVHDVQSVTGELLARSAGMKWWAAVRLVMSSGSPNFLGELTLAGVDPSKVTIGQWCAATYRILTRNADVKERIRIDFELDVPPSGFEDSWDDDVEYYNAMVAAARQSMGTPDPEG